MRYDAVVFDCDGVLIDSERIAVAILTQDLAELGLRMTVAEVHHRSVGWTPTQVAETVAAETGVPVPGAWELRHNEQVRQAVDDSVAQIPGLLDVLATLDRAGV